MGAVSPKLRASAKGQQCTFQTSYCNHDPETTVLCHLPSEVKGMGNKSDDWHAGFGCSECHRVIDQHKLPAEAELFYSLRALQRTQRIWVEMGLMIVPVAKQRESSAKADKLSLPGPEKNPIYRGRLMAGTGE